MEECLDTDLGIAPKDWDLLRVDEIGSVITGNTPSTKNKEYYGGPYKLISPADLDNGKYVTTSHKLITKKGLAVSRILPKNSILVGCIGNIGKIGMSYDEQSATNQQINAIVCNKKANSHYIYYLFLCKRSFLQKKAVKTTLPILNKSNFQEIKLPLPPISEQRKIAHILTTVQKAIEKQEEIIMTNTELKKAMMQKTFTEGLRGEPQKETEIGLVPESWEVVKFNDFCTLKRGKDLTKKNFKEGNIPVAGSNGIIGYHNTYSTKALGITVGRSGSCGKVTYYDRNFWAHNTSLVVIDFHKNDELFTYFYLIQMNLSRFKSGASVPTLDRNQFKDMQIGVPSLNEQKEIAVSLSTIDKKIEWYSKKKEKLENLFQSFLNQLMTGQLRVNNIDFPDMEVD